MAPSSRVPTPHFDLTRFGDLFGEALRFRRGLLASPGLTAVRLLDGIGDGVPGVAVDRLATAAIMYVDDDVRLADDDVTACARAVLEAGAPLGLEAVYVKTRPRDRSRLAPGSGDESRSSAPRAGVPQPPALGVQEHGACFEVHPYDGLSTGLFLEHREHRRALAARPPGRALNLFAYTCTFAVPLAAAGWDVTNVDVSGRYLEWGRRNLSLNGLQTAPVRFLRRDALGYLAKAASRPLDRYDLVILDPPTFGAADHRRGVVAWRAVKDYPALVRAAAAVLAPGGVIFAAANTRELTTAGALTDLITVALRRPPHWLPLPPGSVDVTDRGRAAACLFEPRS